MLKQRRSTIKSTLKRDPLRIEGETRQRSGRPREYDDRDVRKLVRANSKDTWEQVKKACGFTFRKTTLPKMLEPPGITNWRCR